MSQVSKYPLSKAVENECFDLLHETIGELNNRQEIQEFLDDFLSPIEKIMLSKRLAVAVLLGKGYNYEAIRRALHVTPGTIAMVNILYKYSGKGYKRMVDRVLTQEKWQKLWQKIDDVLADLVAPAHTNWSYWRKERWQRKMQAKKSV